MYFLETPGMPGFAQGRSSYLSSTKFRVTIAPATTAVSLAEAKAHCRVDAADDDSLITRLIRAATANVEAYLWRSLIRREIVAGYDRFPSGEMGFALPRPPLVEVVEISYLDASNQRTAMDVTANCTIDELAEPGTVSLLSGKSWPSALAQPSTVRIRFTAGYGTASTDVPEDIREAVMLMIGHHYENREGVIVGTASSMIPLGIRGMLDKHRLWRHM